MLFPSSSFFFFFFFFFLPLLCFSSDPSSSSSSSSSALESSLPFPHRFIDKVPHPLNDQNGYRQYYELTPPLPTSTYVPTHILPVFSYNFHNTTGRWAVKVPYSPPFECPSPWLSVVLQFWGATKGVQEDRIVGVWLEGVEIFRTSTAQPTETGVFWKVEKDITKYSSLLVRSNLTLSVMLDNTINNNLTAFYHVDVYFLYYGFSLSKNPLEVKKTEVSSSMKRRRLAEWTEKGTSASSGDDAQKDVQLKMVTSEDDGKAVGDGVNNNSTVYKEESYGNEVKLKLVTSEDDGKAVSDGVNNYSGENKGESYGNDVQSKVVTSEEDGKAASDGGGDNNNSGLNQVEPGGNEVKLELNTPSNGGTINVSFSEIREESDRKPGHLSKHSRARLDSFGSCDPYYDRPADLIIPISDPVGHFGYWFKIVNGTHIHSKEVLIPPSTYRAVLEIYVSFHENDEFWYSNPPTAYFEKNNITSKRGNGAFRQVFVTLDDLFVGSAELFPVIYTGGINPLLWEPLVGIGSFNLPTYDIELTPFLGYLLDGNSHFLRLGVTNALSYWFVDANLHLWQDPYSPVVLAGSLLYSAPDLRVKQHSKYREFLEGEFEVEAERRTKFSGWVSYSAGNFTTEVEYEFKFKNEIEIDRKGRHIDVEQRIMTRTELKIQDSKRHTSRTVARIKRRCPLRLRIQITPGLAFDTYSLITNVTNGIEVKSSISLPDTRISSILENNQDAGGWLVAKDHFALSGTGNQRQKLRYKDGRNCYSQKATAAGGVIVENIVTAVCGNSYSS